MELTTLKAHIKTGKFDPYYIFTGEDSGVQRAYIKQMAQVLNADIKIFDSITDLGRKNRINTSFSNALVCVLFDDKAFIQDEKAEAFITQNIASDSVLIVFVYTNIDKRTKFYKAHQDKIVDFPHLKPEILKKYVQADLFLSSSECDKLIDACECDYSRIKLEMNKIHTYAEACNKKDGEAFKELLDAGVIYRPPKDAVFDFVDAVLRNKKRLAFELLEESYASGEATLVLLSNLFNSAKQLLQVQAYEGTNKLTDATGLTPFQVKLASGRKDYNSDNRLVELMRLTREAERGIKSGIIEDMTAVPYVLTQFWLKVS